MVDEAHERSISTDILLGLLKKVPQEILKAKNCKIPPPPPFFLEFITFLYILLFLTSRFNAVDLSCAWLFPLLQLKQNQCLLSSKPGLLLRLRVKLDSALACFGFCCHCSGLQQTFQLTRWNLNFLSNPPQRKSLRIFFQSFCHTYR